jgi:hypothetical protein
MATDNLTQLGKKLRKTNKEIEHSTRRVSENFFLVESLRDVIGSIGSYLMEFKTYQKNNNVHLNLFFEEVFDEGAIADITKLPITITDTGLSIGMEGNVGAENIWYPLVYLGDLNFQVGSYSVILNYTKSGTLTQEFKISHDLGEVILTPVVTIGGSTVTIPIVESNVVSPPTRIIHDVYIYGLITGISVAGWIHYSTAEIYLNGQPYEVRQIGI